MSVIVATLSGMSYPDFIAENLFKPLGLYSTASGTHDLRKTGRLCDGFFRKGVDPDVPGPDGWGKPRNIGWVMGDDDGEWAQGHHGLVTCLEDTVRQNSELPLSCRQNYFASLWSPKSYPKAGQGIVIEPYQHSLPANSPLTTFPGVQAIRALVMRTGITRLLIAGTKSS